MRPYVAVSAVVFAAVTICLLPEMSSSTKSLKELVFDGAFINKVVPGTFYVHSYQRGPMKAKITDSKYYPSGKARFWLESLPPLNKRGMIIDVKQSDANGEYEVIWSRTNSDRYTNYSFNAEEGLLQLVESCVNEDASKCSK